MCLEAVLAPIRIAAGERALRRHPAQGRAYDGIVRIKNPELDEQILGLLPRILGIEQRLPVIERPAHGRHELHYRLLRNAQHVTGDPLAQQFRGDALLARETGIEAVDLDVGSKKLATGLQACRSNVFWKGFASPPKTVAPETPAFRPGSAPTALKGGVSTGVSFTINECDHGRKVPRATSRVHRKTMSCPPVDGHPDEPSPHRNTPDALPLSTHSR